MLLINARIVTASDILERGWLLINVHGRIAAFGAGEAPDFEVPRPVIDAEGQLVLPGFIDLHVHGGVGVEAMDASEESLRTLAAFYARHGVTAFLPTTWTAPAPKIHAALEAIASLTDQPLEGASILGAHVEGPYLNPDRCGAQDARQIRRATPEELLPLLETGVVRLMALAPEYPENHWLIQHCVREGIVVSAAHTAATYEQMREAVRMGLRQTTHTFNAMTGLHHREPGTVGAALSLPEISCELIADGIHVHPAVMQVLFAAKGVHRTILITDAVRGAGLPDGTVYEQDGREVRMAGGSARLGDGTLAGSVLTMDAAVRNFLKATGTRLEEVWPVTSLNAARAIGVSGRKGSIEVGKDADLLLLNTEHEVMMTIVGGRIVYQHVS